MKEQFQDSTFRDSTTRLITLVNRIILEFKAKGFRGLTVRQVYYQLIAKNYIKNTLNEYKRLVTVINNGRLAGLIDWKAIEDRTREHEENNHWDNPGEIIDDVAKQYNIEWWEDQNCYVEVWIEKEALVGVIETICKDLDVGYLACRGYLSQSEMYEAYNRFEQLRHDQEAIILHLGDHDPSGLDMTRDIGDRLNEVFQTHVTIERIALNMDQVEELDLPPNPARQTDSRFEEYERVHGDESWELDALDPVYIRDLIEKNIRAYLDTDKWDAKQKRFEEERQILRDFADKFRE